MTDENEIDWVLENEKGNVVQRSKKNISDEEAELERLADEIIMDDMIDEDIPKLFDDPALYEDWEYGPVDESDWEELQMADIVHDLEQQK